MVPMLILLSQKNRVYYVFAGVNEGVNLFWSSRLLLARIIARNLPFSLVPPVLSDPRDNSEARSRTKDGVTV
jgi:hypothetical protein